MTNDQTNADGTVDNIVDDTSDGIAALDPAPDQRTRIRDAALDQFGAYGFRGASIRGIAAAAGVSPGLVQHHFTTKEQLREECDAYVLSVIRGLRVSVVDGQLAKDGRSAVTQMIPTLARVWPYLTRGLLDDGSDVATAWFRRTAEEYREVFADEQFGDQFGSKDDLDALAATYAAMQLGIGVFMNEISRFLNVDAYAPETLVRIGKARILLARRNLFLEEATRVVEDGLDDYLRQARSQQHPGPAQGPDTEPAEPAEPIAPAEPIEPAEPDPPEQANQG